MRAARPAIDGPASNVQGHRPGRSDFIEALPPLRPSDRPWLRAWQCADGVDLALCHGAFPDEAGPSLHIVRGERAWAPKFF
jgi:hypothetical protein